MPAVSKKQWKFMQAIAHGGFKKPGLSPATAKEFVSGQSPKGLPETIKKPSMRGLKSVRIGGK